MTNEEILKEFVSEWEHFCSRINFGKSALDNRAIIFMNEYHQYFQRALEAKDREMIALIEEIYEEKYGHITREVRPVDAFRNDILRAILKQKERKDE